MRLRFRANGGFSIPLLLGIDIGGSKLGLAVGDDAGRVRARLRRPAQLCGDAESDVARLIRDAAQLLERAGSAPHDLAAIGVSVPGPLDRERGVILAPPNLPGWRDVPLRDRIAAAFDRPVYLENDANAAALAEWRFGAAAGLSDVVYLTMSTGVGGGLILGGRLHRGQADCAGEIGHAPVEWDGEACRCGLSGCLEAYVGGAAWTRRLRERTPAASRVATLAGGRAAITPEHVVRAARAGDAFALEELRRFVDYLARGIVRVVFTLAPEAVVLGTIAVAAGEDLCFAPLRERVTAHTWPVLARSVRIVPAALGERLSDYAGICAALEGLGVGRDA
ncbi:MAG: ROK family protein [Deltaproteobacteria bacterium]|nr:MAG: ROK family protein [Deltaproteobacteria bacterium]